MLSRLPSTPLADPRSSALARMLARAVDRYDREIGQLDWTAP
jgi:hypothetical protein